MRLLPILYRCLSVVLLVAVLAGPASAQQWQDRPPMDQPRTGLAVAVLDEQVYLLGGLDQFDTVLDAAVRLLRSG